VTISFTPAGARKLEKVTADNVGKRLAILIGGQLVTALEIPTPILGTWVDLEMAEPEAKQLVGLLNRSR
jgi:preprotein translocase subunit SecD